MSSKAVLLLCLGLCTFKCFPLFFLRNCFLVESTPSAPKPRLAASVALVCAGPPTPEVPSHPPKTLVGRCHISTSCVRKLRAPPQGAAELGSRPPGRLWAQGSVPTFQCEPLPGLPLVPQLQARPSRTSSLGAGLRLGSRGCPGLLPHLLFFFFLY